MADLAGMKQCSNSSLLHHAFEDSVIPGVGRVGDMKVVTTAQGSRIHAGKKNNKYLFVICSRRPFSLVKTDVEL